MSRKPFQVRQALTADVTLNSTLAKLKSEKYKQIIRFVSDGRDKYQITATRANEKDFFE